VAAPGTAAARDKLVISPRVRIMDT